jgi:dTDP-4-amino-4,6-dideoxygalactose transaminase
LLINSAAFEGCVTSSLVPFADPASDLAPHLESILAAIRDVVERGSYILGPEVARFEEAMAARFGLPGAVGVASGTDALVLALLALGVGPGHEVVTASHTAGPTVAAIRIVGATPVLVEVEPDTFCLDPAALEVAVGPLTKAIIAVHLYGHPAALDDISSWARRHGIALVEDCAQAQEATIDGRAVGSIGDAGCFSFYPTKNLGAIGDGGLVAARDPKLVERMRRLRTYGWSSPQYSELPNGRASRLDELQAAILTVKLPFLAEDIVRRRAIAQTYDQAFAGLPLVRPVERAGFRHVYHLYVIRCRERDALARHLKERGIMTARHYPFPVHVQPGLATGARIPAPLAVTERIAGDILSLPLYPSMPADHQTRVIEGVASFFQRL